MTSSLMQTQMERSLQAEFLSGCYRRDPPKGRLSATMTALSSICVYKCATAYARHCLLFSLKHLYSPSIVERLVRSRSSRPIFLRSGRFLNAVHHTNANTYSASGRSRTLSNIAWRTVHALRTAGVKLELMDERLRSMEDVPQTLRVFVLDCSCGAWTTLVVIPSSNTRGGRWT